MSIDAPPPLDPRYEPPVRRWAVAKQWLLLPWRLIRELFR